MNSAALTTVYESIAPDGSGAAGTYKLYHLTLSGIRDHKGRCTARVIGGRTHTRKEQSMARTAVNRVEAHLKALDC